MATYDAIKKLNNVNIRKANTGSLLAAPFSAVALTASNLFVSGGGLATTLGTMGYKDTGFLTDDGIRTTRATESTDETAWQSLEPVRSDLTSDSETLQVDMKETNRTSIELFTGADLSAATLTNGVITITKPALPPSRYYRLLSIGVDSVDGQDFYICKYYPRAKVTGWADQAFAKGTTFNWGVTFTTYQDAALGSASVTWIGGPGMTPAVATGMGFTFA